jgi:hypothetical protein
MDKKTVAAGVDSMKLIRKLIREYLAGLSVRERKDCAENFCGVSLYTLSDLMRTNPRSSCISIEIARGLHEHSNGAIDKAVIRPDIWGK